MKKEFSNLLIILTIINLISCFNQQKRNLGLFSSESENIKINKKDNIYTTKVTIGKYNSNEIPQTFDLKIDTVSTNLWVPSLLTEASVQPKYDDSYSSVVTKTDKIVDVYEKTSELRGLMVYDYVEFSGLSISNYSFTQIITYPNDFTGYPKGKLGFGYHKKAITNNKDENISTDLLSSLYDNNIIKKKVFLINPKDNYINIGEYPPDFDPKKPYSHCNISNVDDLDEYYQTGYVCILSQVFLGYNETKDKRIDNAQIIYGKAIFDFSSEYIVVPKDYLDLFRKKYISRIFNDSCTLVKELKYSYFVCDYNESKINKSSILFILQKYAFPVEGINLFKKISDEKCEMLIRFEKENDNIWTLGFPFMKNYLMLFNQEDNNVIFMKGKVVNMTEQWHSWVMGETPKQKREKLFILVCAVVILGSILMLIVLILVLRAARKNHLKDLLAREHGPLIKSENM